MSVFDFTRWDTQIIFLFPAVVNLSAYLYITFGFPRNRLSAYFGWLLIVQALWQFSNACMGLSTFQEQAMQWHRFSAILLLMLIPFGLRFILLFTGWNKKIHEGLLSFLLLSPTLFLTTGVFFDKYRFAVLPSGRWYWIAYPLDSFFTKIICAWVVACSVFMLLLLLLFWIKSSGNKQSFLLLCGISIPVLGGLIAEVVLPVLLKTDRMPLTSALATAFSVASIIAIKKYRLLDYSPSHHWENIIERLNEGILIVDNDDRIMYANSAFCNLLGYTYEELHGKIAHKLFLSDEPGSGAFIKERIAERKENTPGQYELEMKTKTGEKLWMIVSGSPYSDDSGKVIGSIGIQTNITGLKKYEKSLEENEARLKQAQAVAHVGSWQLNFATGLATWSEEACRIYGVPAEERAKQTAESWASFIHPDDAEGVSAIRKKLGASCNSISFEHRIVRRDRSVRHIHSVAQLEYSGGQKPTGLFGICYDMTEQIETEKALHESERRMKAFIDESLLAIYFLDVKTRRVIYSNKAFRELLGYTDAEISTLKVYDFIEHSHDDVDKRIEEITDIKKTQGGERQWRHKDGRTVHVLISTIYQVRNGEDTIFVAAQDINKRKQAEERLRITNKELETFIYKSSHDIRGPLASILGLVNITMLECHDEVIRNYLSMIQTASNKLDNILQNLVNAMKIREIGAFDQRIDFPLLIRDVYERFSHYEDYKKINFTYEVHLNEKEFRSNQFILDTIFHNLAENAVKYINKSSESPYLKIGVSSSASGIQISFKDNGIGIDPALQGRIFEMYFRATDKSKGSGLGLYLVKQSVDKLNGQISLQSETGKGSTFIIELPFAAG